MESCYDLTECGLSRTIFTHQCVDFAGEEGHGYILKRLGIGKMRLMSAPIHFNALSGFNLEASVVPLSLLGISVVILGGMMLMLAVIPLVGLGALCTELLYQREHTGGAGLLYCLPGARFLRAHGRVARV